jgi:hypothetical protein
LRITDSLGSSTTLLSDSTAKPPRTDHGRVTTGAAIATVAGAAAPGAVGGAVVVPVARYSAAVRPMSESGLAALTASNASVAAAFCPCRNSTRPS